MQRRETTTLGETLLLGLMVWAVTSSTALADEESVRTTTGDVLRGDVVEYREGEDAVIEVEEKRTIRVPAAYVAQVDMRVESEGRIPSLVGPLVMMSAGLVVGIAGAFVSAMASFCLDWSSGCDTDDGLLTLGIGMGVVGGMAFLIGTVFLLPMQVRRRRAWKQGRVIRITPSLGRRGGRLELGVTF